VAKFRRLVSFLGNRRGTARLGASLLLGGAVAGVVAGSGPAGASTARVAAVPTCPGWVAVKPPDPGAMFDDLFGVAVVSASNVWAVGDYTNAAGVYRTLIEHWNGRGWKQVASPSPGIGSNYLGSITAVSATNIWAAGEYSTQSGGIAANKTLILHWNGHVWRQVASPSPGSLADDLNTIRRVSATSIWAVGLYAGADIRDRSLILHWNGRTWSRVASPNPGAQADVMTGLAVVSGSSIWATELYRTSQSADSTSLILHWNGHAWGRAAAGPSGSDLLDVSASSANNAWAVGGDAKGNSLAMHWNGHAWSRVAAPSLKPGQLTNTLESVTVLSPTSAWAVGGAEDLFNFDSTAIEMHWNGRKWSMMASPAPGGTSTLSGVQAKSTVGPWAVGEYGLSTQVQRTLVFRCR
jgi:hypothetical protein